MMRKLFHLADVVYDCVVQIVYRLLDHTKFRYMNKYLCQSHPTLRFHGVHGSAVQLSKEKSVAERDQTSYQNGLVFSERPLRLNEVVGIRILHRSLKWKGTLYFGFTNRNPAYFSKYSLKSASALLQPSTDGFCVIGVPSLYDDYYAKLTFSLNSYGLCVYQVDDNKMEVYQTECLDLSRPIWCVIDLFGSVTAVQLINSKFYTEKPLEFENLINESTDATMSSKAEEQALEYSHVNVLSPVTNMRRRFCKDYDFLDALEPVDYSLVDKSKLCIICMERKKSYAFMECGHFCCCKVCAMYHFGQQFKFFGSCRCPVCRGPVTHMVRIYD